MRHRFTARHALALCPRIALGLWVAIFLWMTAGVARAETPGKEDYLTTCAVCHGTDGKGKGEAVRVLVGLEPGDLTQLSKRNGGKFPSDAVYRAIDGRDEVCAHHLGSRRMPVWGLDFELGSEQDPESEARIKRRISALVSYIESIQQK